MREFKLADGSILEVDDDFQVINVTVISDPVPRFRAYFSPNLDDASKREFKLPAGCSQRSVSNGK